MTEQRIICDRCKGVVIEARTYLRVECGPLRRSGRDALDLCGDCAEAFAAFLRAAEADDAFLTDPAVGAGARSC